MESQVWYLPSIDCLVEIRAGAPGYVDWVIFNGRGTLVIPMPEDEWEQWIYSDAIDFIGWV